MKILKEHDGFEECFAALDKALSLLDEETSPLTDVAELGNGSTADSALAIGVYCACVMTISVRYSLPPIRTV